MRTTTAISLIVASVTAVAALPVQAQGVGAVQRPQLQRIVATSNTACARSFADARCIDYQRRTIAAVATATSRKPVSVEEAGKRQLDALLRTIG